MFTIGAAISTILTEALKKAVSQKFSSNLLALIVSLVVGLGGTSSYYYLMDIPFSGKNIVCMLLMTVSMWIGAMVGYDKIKQVIGQIKEQK
jgi:hypothetical protein